MSLMLGRKPARYTAKSMRRMVILGQRLASLGLAPTASADFVSAVEKATGGDWGMCGNDTVGDCTEADSAHQLMLRTANAGTLMIPTTAQVLARYSLDTGFDPNAKPDANGDNPTDQGADELSIIEDLEKTPFLGYQDDAAANIDPSNIEHLKWGVQLFGAIRLGVNLPQSAMDQFNAGKEWDVIASDGGIIGGHDVPMVMYDASGLFYIVTWGKRIAMTPAFLAKYVDEAHAELSTAWLNATGMAPSGFNQATLVADLQAVAN
jgi:hypothetical protein